MTHAVTVALATFVATLLLVPSQVWAAAVRGVLALLSLERFAPQWGVEAGSGHLDKLVHALLFAALAWAVRRSWRLVGRGSVWWVVFWCTLYGAGLELLQSLVGRVPELLDVAADLAGAALYVGWRNWWESRRSSS